MPTESNSALWGRYARHPLPLDAATLLLSVPILVISGISARRPNEVFCAPQPDGDTFAYLAWPIQHVPALSSISLVISLFNIVWWTRSLRFKPFHPLYTLTYSLGLMIGWIILITFTTASDYWTDPLLLWDSYAYLITIQIFTSGAIVKFFVYYSISLVAVGALQQDNAVSSEQKGFELRTPPRVPSQSTSEQQQAPAQSSTTYDAELAGPHATSTPPIDAPNARGTKRLEAPGRRQRSSASREQGTITSNSWRWKKELSAVSTLLGATELRELPQREPCPD